MTENISPEDTHQELRHLIHEYGQDCHTYMASLFEVWRTKDDVDFYRNNLDESMEAVIQYVNTNYRRKLK